MNEDTVKKMALVVAANCFEQDSGPLANASDDEKKAFNQQISNRLYTFFLYLLSKPSNEYSALMSELTRNYTGDWPLPSLDANFLKIANNAAHMNHSTPMV